MGDRIKRTADDKLLAERFFRSQGKDVCKVCGWPATKRDGAEDYCEKHLPKDDAT